MKKLLVNMFCGLIWSKRLRDKTRGALMKSDRELSGMLSAIKNALRVNFDISRVPPARGWMRMQQMAGLKVLVAFDKLAKDIGIKYWLSDGTLLGAHRHGGFIPWDDDIDVSVIYDDFIKLAAALRKLPRDGMFRCNFFCGFIQIKAFDGNAMLGYVDVFPFARWHEKMDMRTIEKVKRGDFHYMKVNREKIKNRIVPVAETDYYGTAREYDFLREICMGGKSPAPDGTLFKIVGGDDVFYDEWIFPLGSIMFEGREFPCARNPAAVLAAEYGDIYDYPPDMFSTHHKRMNEHVKKSAYENRGVLIDKFLALSDDEVFDRLAGKK
jgi:lipopolysaccharide cholinephosphotransferase